MEPQLPGLRRDEPHATAPTSGGTQREAVARTSSGRRGAGTRPSPGAHVEDLAPILSGWTDYFRLAEAKGVFEDLDGWMRRTLRCIMWRQWKRPRTRAEKLMQRGLEEARAYQAAYNGRGPWWNAGASHMNDAYRKAYFDQLGLISLLNQHRRLNHAS